MPLSLDFVYKPESSINEKNQGLDLYQTKEQVEKCVDAQPNLIPEVQLSSQKTEQVKGKTLPILDFWNQETEEQQLNKQAEKYFRLEQEARAQPEFTKIPKKFEPSKTWNQQFAQQCFQEKWIEQRMHSQQDIENLTPEEQSSRNIMLEKEWADNQLFEEKWLEQKWPQQLDLKKDETALRMIRMLWLKQKGPKILDLQTQEFRDLPLGLRIEIPKVLNKINKKCVQHNNKFTVKLCDWWNWFCSLFTGRYESNRYSLLQFNPNPEFYEGQDIGLPLSDIEAKEAIQRVQSFFPEEIFMRKRPPDWVLESFKRRINHAISKRMNDLKALIERGKKISDQQEHYEDCIRKILDQEKLALYLESFNKCPSNLRTLDDIHYLLYAYLNFYFKWPEETGRPLIELVDCQFFSGEKHSILLLGRDPKTSLDDPSSWNETVRVMDSYERQEDLQYYFWKEIRLTEGVQLTTLLTNEPIQWDGIPEQVFSEFCHLYSQTGIEIEQIIDDIIE